MNKSQLKSVIKENNTDTFSKHRRYGYSLKNDFYDLSFNRAYETEEEAIKQGKLAAKIWDGSLVKIFELVGNKAKVLYTIDNRDVSGDTTPEIINTDSQNEPIQENNKKTNKNFMKINETQLRQIIRECINEYKKKTRRSGKIQNKEGEWVDATEDGRDKYGNPMYRTKDSSITYGSKCKDGSRRVQDFNFRPNVNESKLRNIIKESINKVLNEDYALDAYSSVWNLIEDMKQYMSVEDILTRLITRIGPDAAVRHLQDIKSVEIDTQIESEESNPINESDFFDNANTKPQKEKFMWPKTGEINIGGQLDIRKVMDFIQKNGLNGQTMFNFNNGCIITSLYADGDKNAAERFLESYPLEEWNDYNGMKCFKNEMDGYVLYINGILYFVTTEFN